MDTKLSRCSEPMATLAICVVALLACQVLYAAPEGNAELTFERSESDTVISQHSATIRKLMRLLEADPETLRTHASDAVNAVYTLGQLRAKEAVPLLIKHIDSIQPFFTSDAPRGRMNPCVTALVWIGKPASDAALAALAAENDKWRRLRLVLVVRAVETPSVGKILIERALENEPKPERQANLRAALKTWTSITIDVKRPW